MPDVSAFFIVDNNAQEGQESVVAMMPEPTEDNLVLNAIYKMRPIVVSLTDVSQSVHGTEIASALIDLGPQVNHQSISVSKVRTAGALSIGVALSSRDVSEGIELAKNVLESLRYHLGEIKCLEIGPNLEAIKYHLEQFVFALGANYCRSIYYPLLFEGLVSGIKPSLSVSKRLRSVLSSLEVCETSNEAAFTLLPRHSFPIGSCLFRKGICIHTNMLASDLIDTARFCVLNRVLSRTEHDGLLVLSKPVFSTNLEQRVISVIASGHSVICMLLHRSSDRSFDSHIDPFCVSEMKSVLFSLDHELSDKIDNDISRVSHLIALSCELPSKVVSRHANKQGTYQHVIIPPKPRSAPSSPTVRRKSADAVQQRVEQNFTIEQSLGQNGRCLLRFRIVDRQNKFTSEIPLVDQDSLDIQIADCFAKAVSVLKRKLSASASGGETTVIEAEPGEVEAQPVVELKSEHKSGKSVKIRSMNQNLNGNCQAINITETAFHFRIQLKFNDKKTNAFQELGFIVVGRVIPPHHEVYLCIEDTTPQDVINMSFQLIFAWL